MYELETLLIDPPFSLASAAIHFHNKIVAGATGNKIWIAIGNLWSAQPRGTRFMLKLKTPPAIRHAYIDILI